MNFTGRLDEAIARNDSLLCIGLDPDINRMPGDLNRPADIFEFNRSIIDETADLVCAYKPNTAFYEAFGPAGIEQLKRTCEYVRQTGLPLIIDAKRADIGHTNKGYVDFIFDYLGADAVTLNPYLGREALSPFFGRKEKGLIILCRTSNSGAGEFQDFVSQAGEKLYQAVARRVTEEWNKDDNCLLVVGATYPDELADLRRQVGDEIVFLVPGVGEQGGDVRLTVEAGQSSTGSGLIINSGRSIIYAGRGQKFAEAARGQAEKLRDEINKYRKGRKNG